MRPGNKPFVTFIICTLLYVCAYAGSKDSLEVMRDFITVCNAYKQLPLHLQMVQRNTTNYATGENDTTTTEGDFYITNSGAYVRFGEMEQITDSSLAVMVSDRLKRIIVYRNARPILAYMKTMMGVQQNDTSIVAMGRKYVAERKTGATVVITLSSRTTLTHTELPTEMVEAEYDKSSHVPVRITTVRRTLIPLTEAVYKAKLTENNNTDKLVQSDTKFYMVKELISEYLYKKVEHNSALKIPVQLSERIHKTTSGLYEPTKEYEHYTLTAN